MTDELENDKNKNSIRKRNFATALLASSVALSPAASLQAQAAAAKSAKPNKKEITVNTDKYAKYRPAESQIMQQLVFYEGCVRKAYRDQVGIWTIGIGNTKRPSGERVTQRDRLINNDQVYNYVISHLEREVYPAMDKYITRKLSPNETAAIVSLCYNSGTSVLGVNGKKSPLAEAINKNDKAAIEKYFMKRVSTKKEKFVDHLAIRRAAELYTYMGYLKPADINAFYVGGQRGLKVTDVLKKDAKGNYTVLKKDDQTINNFKKHCQTAPSAAKAPKYAWFGGDKRVVEFANLGGNNTYYAQAKDFQQSQTAVQKAQTSRM